MKGLTLIQLIARYEKVYGDIRYDKRQWVAVYNAYLDKMNWRWKVEVDKEQFIHDGEVCYHITYEYRYSQWGAWDWEQYEYYEKIPNHTRVCQRGWMMDKFHSETEAMGKEV